VPTQEVESDGADLVRVQAGPNPDRLVDRLDELEREVADSTPELRGRVDDAAPLAAGLHDELAERE
jgi:hypothetical protein